MDASSFAQITPGGRPLLTGLISDLVRDTYRHTVSDGGQLRTHHKHGEHLSLAHRFCIDVVL